MVHMASILITGGTGFFGRALLRHWMQLLKSGVTIPNVAILSRSPKKFLTEYPEFAGHEWLTIHKGDILNPKSLPTNVAFTHLLHGATDSTLGPLLSPLDRYRQIVDGTRHMLDYASDHGIGRVLLTSSGGVYGAQPKDMTEIPEIYSGSPDVLNPQNAYSIAKRCAEHLCILYQESGDFEIVIARCFAFVGQDLPLDAHFAIGNFIRDALTRSEIVVQGDGRPVRSYMDQRDLAKWLVALLMKGKAGQAYNVGSDQPITIGNLANLVRNILAPQKAVQIRENGTFHDPRNWYVPCLHKARNELGLELHYSLNDAIRHTALNCSHFKRLGTDQPRR